MLKSSSLCSYSSNLDGADGHNFERGTPKDHSTKVWLQLAQWFLRRRFLCEFPIGSYVPLKLLSQSQPNFAEMILGWSSSKYVSGISELRPIWPPQPAHSGLK
jgi:hypothetical protein